MPIAVTKYRCQFKCGRQAKDSKKAVEEHEAKCWHNPAMQTCKTCKFEHYYTDSDGFQTWKQRDCRHPDGDKITEEMYESLTIDTLHIKPVVNCPHWTHKSPIKQTVE